MEYNGHTFFNMKTVEEIEELIKLIGWDDTIRLDNSEMVASVFGPLEGLLYYLSE